MQPRVLGWEVPPLSTSRLNNMLASFMFDREPIAARDPPYSLEQAVPATVDWMRDTSA
jgi:hypothetical protein